MKRSHAHSSEAYITIESNPYSYKLTQCKEFEAFALSYVQLLRLLSKLLQNLLTKEDEERIRALEVKLHTLVDGKMVGSPSRKI